jgi:hypothetical protein
MLDSPREKRGIRAMKFVQLECQFGDYLVVPEHVSWIQLSGPNVCKVGFIGGSELNTIRGKPEEIAAKIGAALKED